MCVYIYVYVCGYYSQLCVCKVTIQIRDSIQITQLLFKFEISIAYSRSLYGMMWYALLDIWCLEHSDVIRLR
jgi:hypothetical protein